MVAVDGKVFLVLVLVGRFQRTAVVFVRVPALLDSGMLFRDPVRSFQSFAAAGWLMTMLYRNCCSLLPASYGLNWCQMSSKCRCWLYLNRLLCRLFLVRLMYRLCVLLFQLL